MKYIVQRSDGRFTSRMSNQQGPLHFNIAQEWFTKTYGRSAEARQYEDMIQWNQKSQLYFQGIPRIIDFHFRDPYEAMIFGLKYRR